MTTEEVFSLLVDPTGILNIAKQIYNKKKVLLQY